MDRGSRHYGLYQLDNGFIRQLNRALEDGYILTAVAPTPTGRGSRYGPFRVDLTSGEVRALRRRLNALNEFSALRRICDSDEEALERLGNQDIAERVRTYNQEFPSQAFSPAAFLGPHLEALLCGFGAPERYQRASEGVGTSSHVQGEE